MLKKYKSLILYGIFGVATTLVNIGSYFVCAELLHFGVLISTALAWFIAVLFAYVTNKIWVFDSKTRQLKDIVRESVSFFGCRILTGLLDLAIMYVFVERLQLNAMVMKTLANVLVIILNYIASKLFIFKKTDQQGERIKYNPKELLAILIILTLAVIFAMNAPLYFLEQGVFSTDSNVFRFFGKMMQQGYMPYLDLFDHKGPILYLINYIGYILRPTSGIWILETIGLFVTFLFIYKTARLKTKTFTSILVLLLSIINLFFYFESGNLVEEYALPFITISLYIFIDYLLNGHVNKWRLIVCGACLASVALLRVNMIPCWIVFCFAIFIKCIKEKNYRQLGNYLLHFIIGILLVVVPVFAWLISKGAFKAFFEDYIIFNMKYASMFGISAKWDALFIFFNSTMILVAVFANVYAIIREKDKTVYLWNLVYILLSLVMVALSGRAYSHYGMILIPALVVPLTYFVHVISADEHKGLSAMVFVYLLASIVAPQWITLVSKGTTLYKALNNNTFAITEDVQTIKDLVTTHSDKDDRITVYGNWDYIYLITNRLSASKYSYQYPISEVDSKRQEEYFADLEKNNPKLIVVQEGHHDEFIKNFIEDNDYEELWNKDEKIFVYLQNR